MLVNDEALATVKDAHVWNINSVESVAYEYSRYNYNATDFYAPNAFRSSDHDPTLVGFTIPAPPKATATTATISPKEPGVRSPADGDRDREGGRRLAEGRVEVREGDTVLGRGYVHRGVALVPVRFLTAGQHTVTVSYLGTDGFSPSSTTLVVDVQTEEGLIPGTSLLPVKRWALLVLLVAVLVNLPAGNDLVLQHRLVAGGVLVQAQVVRTSDTGGHEAVTYRVPAAGCEADVVEPGRRTRRTAAPSSRRPCRCATCPTSRRRTARWVARRHPAVRRRAGRRPPAAGPRRAVGRAPGAVRWRPELLEGGQLLVVVGHARHRVA